MQIFHKSFSAFKRVVFQISLFLLRIVAVADGDLDDLILVFRSPQGSGFGAVWAAIPAAFRTAAQEPVADFWALAAADEAQDHTKEEKPCADSAEGGNIDATQQTQAQLVFVQSSRRSSLRICQFFFESSLLLN